MQGMHSQAEIARLPEEPEKRRFRTIMLTLANIAAVIAVIIFIITQDLQNQMAMVDTWTIVHVILIAAKITTIILALRKRKEDPLWHQPYETYA
jgi:archaellum biogenesis protein FlaJ (TadC family)